MQITEDAVAEQLINTTFTALGTYFIATSRHAPQTMDVGPVAGTLLGATFIATGISLSVGIASIGDSY